VDLEQMFNKLEFVIYRLHFFCKTQDFCDTCCRNYVCLLAKQWTWTDIASWIPFCLHRVDHL